jgi:carbon-monoxide dehydrogenase large subunit
MGNPNESADVRFEDDGTVSVAVGTQSTGQGHETAWSQIVHEQLGIDWDRIDLLQSDSDALPAGGGTGGSRSLIMAGRTIMLAADEIVQKAKAIAAEKLEAAEADIEFSAAEGGVFRIAGTDRTMKLVDIAADQGGLDGAGGVDDREATFPNGSHAAEVEIDPDTGHVRIARYTIVDDFGKLVNPLLVEGQVHGGVVQGAGQALMEHAVWDPETGQPLTASFMDYAMPRAADTPMLPVIFNENAPCQTNPLGVKGCGEAGAVAATPAITLAVLDALHRAGAGEVDTPLTPEKIWRALNGAKQQAA